MIQLFKREFLKKQGSIRYLSGETKEQLHPVPEPKSSMVLFFEIKIIPQNIMDVPLRYPALSNKPMIQTR